MKTTHLFEKKLTKSTHSNQIIQKKQNLNIVTGIKKNTNETIRTSSRYVEWMFILVVFNFNS